MTASSSTLRPTQDESLERFTVRAHRALLRELPDPEERNAAVKHSWRTHRGPLPEEAIADKTFGPEKYDRSDDHCVFVEHETVASDGSPRKYDLKALAKIVRNHNKEIRDVQAFPSISEHHTPDPGDTNGKEPALLGFSGPFRLGQIGHDKPRWAIFSDEHRLKEAAAKFSQKPFRSVELWTFKNGQMRFHPIAAVGVEAPRLLMPAKYSAKTSPIRHTTHRGAPVEKYTVGAVAVEKYEAGAAVMPGGGNTFARRTDYAGGGSMAPEDIAGIMAAISETPEFQFLRTLMTQQDAQGLDDGMGGDPAMGGDELGGDPAMGGEPDAGGLGDDMGAGDMGDDMGDDMGPPMPEVDGDGEDEGDLDLDGDGDMDQADDDLDDDLSDLDGGDEGDSDQFPDEDEDPDMTKNTQTRAGGASLERYTALQRSHNELVEKYGKVYERLGVLERERTDAVRGKAIQELAAAHPFAVLKDEEEKACLYSLGSKMTDEQFRDRYTLLKTTAERFTNSPMIPVGAMPTRQIPQSEPEKYTQKVAELAVKIHTANVTAGRTSDFATCEAEAKKRLAPSGAAAA